MGETSFAFGRRQPAWWPRRAVLPLLVAGFIGLAGSPASLAAPAAPAVRAPQVDSPKRVLFVGNSYMYYGDSLHNHVRRMVDSGPHRAAGFAGNTSRRPSAVPPSSTSRSTG